MKTKLKQAKTYSKKTLSTILAIVMLIMTCSVAFGVSAYTQPTTSVLTQLVEAFKTDGAIALGDTSDTSVMYTEGTNSSTVSTVTNTITTDSYSDYVDITNLVDLFYTEADYAVWYSASATTANTRGYNGEAYAQFEGADTSVTRKSYGENMASINAELKERLEDAMGSNDYIAYKVSTIVDIIFEEWSGNDYVNQKEYDNSSSAIHGSQSSVTSNLTFNLSVTTSDYVGWLADSSNDKTDYANMELQSTYTVTMTYCSDSDSYSWGSWDFGGETYYQYVYLFSDDNNDYITTDTTTTNTSAVTNFIEAAQYYENLMDRFLEYASYEAAYAHYLENVTLFEIEYNALVSAQQDMKTTLGGSTYLISMFANGEAYEDILDNYEIAMDAGLYQAAASGWYSYETNYPEYGVYNYDGGETFGDGVTLNADYIDFTTNYYDILMNATDSAREYFMTYYDLDTNYYTEFTNNVTAYKAAAIKAELDALVEQYGDIDPATLEESEQQLVYTAVDSYLTTLSKYDSKITSDTTLFTEDDFDAYYDLEAAYACSINSTVAWFYTWGNASYSEYTTTELLNVLQEYDSYVTKLIEFQTTLTETVGTQTATDLLASTWAYTDDVTGIENSIILYLASRLSGQVSAAVTMYESIEVDSYADIDVITFANLKTSVGAVDTEIYDLLVAQGYWVADNGYVTSTDVSNYASLSTIMTFYNQFAATYGFDNYVDSSLTYTYSSRVAYDTIDTVKDEEEVTYDVDSTDINKIITTIDSLLQDEAILSVVGELLGVDMSSGLSDVIKDLIENMLFSDDILNMIVGTLYPLATDYLLDFADDNLPSSVYIYVGTIYITYADTIPGLAGDAGLGLYPEDVAACFTDKTTYADAYNALTEAGRSWYSSSIYSTASGSYTINWGIDDAKASNEAGETDIDIYDLFVGALGNALQGIFPAVDALLCGHEMSIELKEAAYAKLALTTHEGNATLSLTACDAYVNVFGAIYEALGYYSYCGTTWIDNNINDAVDIVDMIFSDIYGLLDYLLEAPIERIMDALPNVVYALMFDMIPELLTLIETQLTYVVGAEFAGWDWFTLDNLYSGTEELNIGELVDLASFGLDTSDGIYFIFDLIGIDVNGLDEGLLATLGELVEVEKGTNNIDQTKRNEFIYSNDHNGAWHIEADTEAVFYYIITFLIDYVKSGDLYLALGSLMDADAIVEVESIVDMLNFNSTYVSSGDVVATIVELFEPYQYSDEGYFSLDAVAANLDTYIDEVTGKEYTAQFGYYYNEESGLFERETYDEYYYVGNDENGDPIYEPLYTEYWTQEQAEFVVNDLPNYITEIASLFDLDTTVTEFLTSTVTDLLDSLYTTDTIDMILDLIQPLIIEYTQDDETISMIVDIIVELDIIDGDIDVGEIITHLTTFTYDAFDDGDEEAFIEVVVDFLEPLVPILDLFLLSSNYTEEDVDAITGSISIYDGAITIKSYNGYTSALIPLLEAIGCDSEEMLSYEEFETSSNEEKIYAILDPILGLIDTYFGETDNEYAIYSILQIIPNILYFIEYGGLNTAISNILKPVYAILDTIRPIYNLQFSFDLDVYDMLNTIVNDLIAGAGIEDYLTITIDIPSLIKTLMSFGYTEERTSVTGDTYNYFILYETGYAELLTVVLYELVDEIVFGEDIQQYIDLLGSLGGVLGTDSEIGIFLTDLAAMESGDQVVLILYYLVYGLETGTGIYDSLSDTVKDFLIDFIGTDSEYFSSIFDRTSELLNQLGAFFGGDDYVAENDEVLNWFQQILADIKAFFEKIFSWLSF